MGNKSGSQETTETVPAFVTEGGEFGVDRAKKLAELGYMPYFGPDVAALSPAGYAAQQNTQAAANAFNMAAPGGGGMPSGGGGGGPQFTGNPQSMTGNYQAATVGDDPRSQAINDAYQKQLGRTPDQAGYDFWQQNYNPDTFQQDFAGGTQVDPLTGLPQPGNFGGMSGYSSAPIYQGALDELQRRRPGQFDAFNEMFIDSQTGERPSGGDETRGLMDFAGKRSPEQESIELFGSPDYAYLFRGSTKRMFNGGGQ